MARNEDGIDNNETNELIRELEDVTNDYLQHVRELEYRLRHFIEKSNRMTALNARNALRDVTKIAKQFKEVSIAFFK